MNLCAKAIVLILLSSAVSITAVAQILPTQRDAYTWQGTFPVQHQTVLNRDAALARVCVEEVDWDGYKECAAVYYALKTKASMRHMSLWRHMHMYAWPAFNPDQRPKNRMWVAYLHQDLIQPYFWPDTLRWRTYRIKWLKMIAYAHELWLGNIANPCDGEPMDWAASWAVQRINHYKHDYPNAIEIICGENTKNRFFRIRP